MSTNILGIKMIELSKVTKTYGPRFAVRDLSFSIQKGEVVGLLGPNGAGKTTTMKMITGHTAPNFGEIKIDGEDILEKPLEIKKKIGYLPEIPPLYGDMYVQSYLYYVAGLKSYPKQKTKARVEFVIDTLGLQEVRSRLIQNISKGFKQRVGLAQALVSDPEILILDEPTVGLDPNQVLEMRKLIFQLKGQHTIILSTHILSEVQASCDRVIIIKEGEMVTQESLSSLREKQSQSRRKLIIRVKNSSQDLINRLERIKGVSAVQAQNNTLSLLVSESSSSDINEQVAKKVMEKGAGLKELKESFNLEDVFLELTSKGESTT